MTRTNQVTVTQSFDNDIMQLTDSVLSDEEVVELHEVLNGLMEGSETTVEDVLPVLVYAFQAGVTYATANLDEASEVPVTLELDPKTAGNLLAFLLNGGQR